MGVTPNSDTQQNIAIHAANITHHGSIAQTSKNRLRSELFLPAFFCGLRFMIHVLMMAIRLQSYKRLKSPVRFTGGRAVHWM